MGCTTAWESGGSGSYVLEQQLAQCGLVLAMTSQPRLAVSIIPTRVALPFGGVAEGVTIEPSVVYVSSAIGVCMFIRWC